MKFSIRAIQLVAEAKIEQAQKDGLFENLSGFGKPLDLDQTQYDPNWWIRGKIKRENLQALVRSPAEWKRPAK